MEEEEAPDIDIYHCPNCEKTHGKSTRKYLSLSRSQPSGSGAGDPSSLADCFLIDSCSQRQPHRLHHHQGLARATPSTYRLPHVKCGLGAQVIKEVFRAPASPSQTHVYVCEWLCYPSSRSSAYPTQHPTVPVAVYPMFLLSTLVLRALLCSRC